MKKRRLKGWVKVALEYIVMIAIGLLMFFALCERAEQIDRNMAYEETY